MTSKIQHLKVRPWVRIQDRQPVVSERYLLYFAGVDLVAVGYYNTETRRWRNHGISGHRPTHWTTTPKRPRLLREEKEQEIAGKM